MNLIELKFSYLMNLMNLHNIHIITNNNFTFYESFLLIRIIDYLSEEP